MATNPAKGDNPRKVGVRDRSQARNEKIDHWIKGDQSSGQFISQEDDGKPYKGVTKER